MNIILEFFISLIICTIIAMFLIFILWIGFSFLYERKFKRFCFICGEEIDRTEKLEKYSYVTVNFEEENERKIYFHENCSNALKKIGLKNE